MKPEFLASCPYSRRISRAFTLIEILVVVAIIGMLFTLLVNRVGHQYDESQIQIAKLFVNQSMQAPLMAYKINMGDFPTTAEGFQALIAPPAAKADQWRGAYIQGNQAPLDPWKEPYQYRYPGVKNKTSYDLWSKGPDHTDGTEDDIGNW
jgi:general secretion pathway protein G